MTKKCRLMFLWCFPIKSQTQMAKRWRLSFHVSLLWGSKLKWLEMVLDFPWEFAMQLQIKITKERLLTCHVSLLRVINWNDWEMAFDFSCLFAIKSQTQMAKMWRWRLILLADLLIYNRHFNLHALLLDKYSREEYRAGLCVILFVIINQQNHV